MKRLIPTLLILMLVIGCGCPKQLVASQSVTDTLVVEKKVVLRDTVFQTKTAKVFVEVPTLNIEHFDKLSAQEGNARVIIQRVRDTLRVTAQCDSLKLRAQLRDELTHEIQKTHVVDTQIIKVRYTPWPVKALAWVGGIGLGLIGVKIAFKNSLPF